MSVVHFTFKTFSYAVIALFLSGYGAVSCSDVECTSHSDCSDGQLCVSQSCEEVSQTTNDGSPDYTGNYSGGNAVPDNSETEDTDTDSSTDTDTTVELDTTYGSIFSEDDTATEFSGTVGCVTFHTDYYSCTLASTYTSSSCDLINTNGCSYTLFPESCVLYLYETEYALEIITCYSSYSTDVENPPDDACVEAGGVWMACPL